jgi:hypothetical protein
MGAAGQKTSKKAVELIKTRDAMCFWRAVYLLINKHI